MSDADLEEIRRARLQQLQQQGGGSGQDPSNPSSQQQQSQKQEQEAHARTNILSQILTPEASDRLNRIRLVKEQRATDVEDRLIVAARQGGLRGRVGEEELKGLLGRISEMENGKGTGEEGGGKGKASYRVVRRGGWDGDDGFDDLDDLGLDAHGGK